MPTPSSMTSLVFYKCVSGTTLSSPCLLFAPPHFFLPFASSLKATSHDPPAASDVVSLVHTLFSVTSLLFCQLVRLQVCMMSVWLPFTQISASCVCARAQLYAMHALYLTHTHAYTHTVGRRVISSVTTSGSSNSDSTRAIYSRRGSLHTVWHVMTCVPARLCGKGACGTWKKSQVCACVCVCRRRLSVQFVGALLQDFCWRFPHALLNTFMQNSLQEAHYFFYLFIFLYLTTYTYRQLNR